MQKIFMGTVAPGVLILGLSACGDGGRDFRPVFLPEDNTFHVGPYIGHTTETSVSIGWETEQQGDTRLHWGEGSSYGQLAEGTPGTMHQVHIDGIEAGRRYHYRACSAGVCTRDLTFDAALPPEIPYTIGIYGDCQDNPDIHRQVVDLLLDERATLAVVVGDLVSDGSVREEYKERYFDPARVFAQVRPRYPAVGNHDRKDIEVAAFIDYAILPEDPGVPQAETSYSFSYGDAFYLVFDNTLDHYDLFFPPVPGNEPPLWLWLNEQVKSPAARAARWRFAFAHYPPGSNCYAADHEYGLPESAVKEYVIPLLKENGFQAYFAGHMHCYERFDFDGFLVITTGGGGGTLEDQSNCDDGFPEARFQSCVHHATFVELGEDRARVRVRNIDGSIIEEFDLAL